MFQNEWKTCFEIFVARTQSLQAQAIETVKSMYIFTERCFENEVALKTHNRMSTKELQWHYHPVPTIHDERGPTSQFLSWGALDYPFFVCVSSQVRVPSALTDGSALSLGNSCDANTLGASSSSSCNSIDTHVEEQYGSFEISRPWLMEFSNHNSSMVKIFRLHPLLTGRASTWSFLTSSRSSQREAIRDHLETRIVEYEWKTS